MNSLLSLILCIAMLLGGGAFQAVPTTQTVLDVKEISVDAGDESVEVTPDLKLTFALGFQSADIRAETPAGSAPAAALRFLPASTLLWTGGERIFNADAAALSALTDGWTDKALPTAPMSSLIDCLASLMIEDTEMNDAFSLFMDALSAVTGAESETDGAFAYEEGQTVAAAVLNADVSYEVLLNALDELRARGGSTADLLDAYLSGTVRTDAADGSVDVAYTSFSEMMNGESDECLSAQLVCGREEGALTFNRLNFEPIGEDGTSGSFTLETTVHEGESMKIVLSVGLYEDREFTYDATLDLKGTPDDIQSLDVIADMQNISALSPTESEESDTAETADQMEHSRHFELNSVRTDDLWNAACNISDSRTRGNEEPSQTDISIGYSESREENEAVTGTVDMVYTKNERDFDLLFEIARTKEPYVDSLKDLTVMTLSDSKEDIPAMVFGLDLQDLKTRLMSALEEESVSEALRLMGVDGSSLLQTAAAPAEEPVAEAAEPDYLPA